MMPVDLVTGRGAQRRQVGVAIILVNAFVQSGGVRNPRFATEAEEILNAATQV